MASWVEAKTMDGLTFYIDQASKAVSWDKPPELLSEAETDHGDWTWVPHPTEFWQPARRVSNNDDGSVTCVTAEGVEVVVPKSRVMQEALTDGRKQEVPLWKMAQGEHNHAEDDLIMLENVNDGSIIYCLKKGYANKSLYTWVGASHRVLVSINPYQRLPLYGEDVIKQHREKSPNIDTPPHIFDVANDSYDEMLFEGQHQSILISGESGAGKTEATKQCLKFWASVAGSKNGVEERLIQANPVLEAFGNAKTIRNNNSSRFGKWQEVYFDQLEQSIDGALIINYLLEKSRLVHQQSGERNFHIFHQLTQDASARAAYELEDATKYRYTNRGLMGAVPGIDDKTDFSDCKKAMMDLEFSTQEQEWLLRVPAAILHLGNCTFVDSLMANNVTGSKLESDAHLIKAAQFLDVEVEKLRKVLLFRSITVNKETSVIPLNAASARAGCDSIAKGIYGRLFDWLVKRVNTSLKGDTSGKFIGVLDIFGFEIFDVNSFEQLCINYANEKLQQLFNLETFKDEEALYQEEGIPFSHIAFIDSEPVLSMIERAPTGILLQLDDECRVPEGEDTKFMSKIEDTFASHPNFATDKHRKLNNQLAFEIVHYAGTVKYTSDDFMLKNKDTFYQDAHDMGATSKHPLTAGLFPTLDVRIQIKSLSSVFRSQLGDLMNKLNTTSTRYVRCIKPNESMAPLLFEAPLVLRQLRYSGVFEAVAIRKQGYPFRQKFEAFSFRFRAINPDHVYKSTEPRALCEEIIKACPSKFKDLVFGKTMVLYRAPEFKLLKLLRNLALETIIPRVQGILKGALARAERKRMLQAERTIQTALDLKCDQAKVKEALAAVDGTLGTIHKRLWPKLRPRNEQEAKDVVAKLQKWLDFQVVLEDVLKKDPNKNFLAYLKVKEDADALQGIPATPKQKELVALVNKGIDECEVGKLDAKCKDARTRMDRAAMEELVGKAKDFAHESPAVDELRRVLALPERKYIDLEFEAATSMGDSERAQTCRSRMWELDGEEAVCVKVRQEMDKEGMQAQLAKAKEWKQNTDGVKEITRVLGLGEREYLGLEIIAGEEMRDSKRVKRCKGRLLEMDMSELPASYGDWRRFKGLRSPEDYAKGKWFGKAATRDGMLVVDKAVINNPMSAGADDPSFKKLAKDMNKGVLAFIGLKPDPRGDSAMADAFSSAARNDQAKTELYLQLLKATMASPKVPSCEQANSKALDLLGAFLCFAPPTDEELFKFVYIYTSKKAPKYAKAAARGKFDTAAAPRSGGDIARLVSEVNSLANDQVALS